PPAATHSARSVRAFPEPCSSSLLRVVEQFPADQHAPDFRRAGADLVQLGVAPEPTGGIVVNVPVPAQGLDRFAGHPGRLLRRVEYRARRILARGLAPVAGLADRVDVGPAGAQ